MFLRVLGKHLLLRLDKTVYRFTLFLDQLLYFYCIAFLLYSIFIEFTKEQHGRILHKDEHIHFYGIFYHVAL